MIHHSSTKPVQIIVAVHLARQTADWSGAIWRLQAIISLITSSALLQVRNAQWPPPITRCGVRPLFKQSRHVCIQRIYCIGNDRHLLRRWTPINLYRRGECRLFDCRLMPPRAACGEPLWNLRSRVAGARLWRCRVVVFNMIADTTHSLWHGCS